MNLCTVSFGGQQDLTHDKLVHCIPRWTARTYSIFHVDVDKQHNLYLRRSATIKRVYLRDLPWPWVQWSSTSTLLLFEFVALPPFA